MKIMIYQWEYVIAGLTRNSLNMTRLRVKPAMTALFIFALLVLFCSNAFSNTPRWTVDNRHLSNSMTVTAVVVNSGVEMRSEQIEIGAFSDDECRGSAFLQYVAVLDRYIVFLMIFGEGGETVTLKLFDHAVDEEYYVGNSSMTFAADGIHGNPTEPFSIVLGAPVFVTLLDFDDYVATKWNNNTFMLDLARLENDGYAVVACNWYRDDNLLFEGFTYSAGSRSTDRIQAGVYRFEVTADDNVVLRSTDKIIGNQASAVGLLAYPNPLFSGGVLTIENIAEGSLIEVYNQSGLRLIHTVATGSPATLSLDTLPAGVYVVRTVNGETKIIIEN